MQCYHILCWLTEHMELQCCSLLATYYRQAWTAARGLAGTQQSTFASGTDRFAGATPGSLYSAAAAGMPAAGED